MNRSIIKFIISLVVLSALWLVWQEIKAQGADWFPVKHVRIEGSFQYIAKDKLKQVLQGQLTHGLYNVDLQQIQQTLNELPWIKKASVKRVWPDAINIKIEEHRPIVRWGDKGLLDQNGNLFYPDNMKNLQQIPLLTGTVGYEKKLLEIMKGVVLSLQDRKFVLTEFHVNKRGAWKIKLKNGMKLMLGQKEPLKKFQLFLKTFSLIGKSQEAKVAIVDLRYPNGYALTWKTGGKAIDWKKITIMNNR